MVLNLLRVEEVNPEYMMERSFFQFQNYSNIPKLYKGEFEPSCHFKALSQRMSRLSGASFSDNIIISDQKLCFYQRVFKPFVDE